MYFQLRIITIIELRLAMSVVAKIINFDFLNCSLPFYCVACVTFMTYVLFESLYLNVPLSIQGIPFWNVSLETGYPDRVFVIFLLTPD
jgi:hypothetical protein